MLLLRILKLSGFRLSPPTRSARRGTDLGLGALDEREHVRTTVTLCDQRFHANHTDDGPHGRSPGRCVCRGLADFFGVRHHEVHHGLALTDVAVGVRHVGLEQDRVAGLEPVRVAAPTSISTVPAVTTRFSTVPGGCASACSTLPRRRAGARRTRRGAARRTGRARATRSAVVARSATSTRRAATPCAPDCVRALISAENGTSRARAIFQSTLIVGALWPSSIWPSIARRHAGDAGRAARARGRGGCAGGAGWRRRPVRGRSTRWRRAVAVTGAVAVAGGAALSGRGALTSLSARPAAAVSEAFFFTGAKPGRSIPTGPGRAADLSNLTDAADAGVRSVPRLASAWPAPWTGLSFRARPRRGCVGRSHRAARRRARRARSLPGRRADRPASRSP